VAAVHKLGRVGLYTHIIAGLGALAFEHPLADELLNPRQRYSDFRFRSHILQFSIYPPQADL
jgi:hypothetical protein